MLILAIQTVLNKENSNVDTKKQLTVATNVGWALPTNRTMLPNKSKLIADFILGFRNFTSRKPIIE
jgi:hypothetical protein